MLWQTLVAAWAVPGVLGAAAPIIPAPGALKMDFSVVRGSSKRDLGPNREGGLVRRSDPEGAALLELTNEQTYYSCDLYIGSNKQKSTVLVDTGSSDLWIMDSDMTCLPALNLKRDFSLFFRVVPLPLPLEDEKTGNDEKREEGEEKREDHEKREEDEGSDLEERACIGMFCFSFSDVFTDVFTETDIPEFASYSTAYITPTGTASGTRPTQTGFGANSCTTMGSFETADLGLFKLNNTAPAFSILYGDGTSAKGFWGRDLVLFNNHTVSNMSFAVVNETDSTFGVLGIGLTGLETTYSLAARGSYMYENFPVRLVRSGIIHKNVYSLFLNKQSADTGSVLFGAVDHAKYSGTLQTVPIINIYSNYYNNPIRLDVVLDSISLEGTSSNTTVTSVHVPALLDSGTTFSYLPSAMLERFASALGGTYSSSAGLYQVSCKYNSDSAHAIFTFSGANIRVPLSDLIVKHYSQCYLGLFEQSKDSATFVLLGDNFLRNAYVVYNLDDFEVSLAQVVYTDEEDIEVVTLTVPLAVRAASYSATSIQSGASDSGSVTLVKPSALSTSGSSTPKKNDAERHGVSVAAILGLMCLTAFALM